MLQIFFAENERKVNKSKDGGGKMIKPKMKCNEKKKADDRVWIDPVGTVKKGECRSQFLQFERREAARRKE